MAAAVVVAVHVAVAGAAAASFEIARKGKTHLSLKLPDRHKAKKSFPTHVAVPVFCAALAPRSRPGEAPAAEHRVSPRACDHGDRLRARLGPDDQAAEGR